MFFPLFCNDSHYMTYNGPNSAFFSFQENASQGLQTIFVHYFFYWQIGAKNLKKRKFIVEPSFCHKLDNNNWKCTQAHVQENKSRFQKGFHIERHVFLIPKISCIIRRCKFVLQGACIFLKKNQNDMCFSNWNKKPDEEKIYRWTEFFHKLDNNKWKMHTGARARKQKYISIYISLHMKTFLKTGVCIYFSFFTEKGASSYYWLRDLC